MSATRGYIWHHSVPSLRPVPTEVFITLSKNFFAKVQRLGNAKAPRCPLGWAPKMGILGNGLWRDCDESPGLLEIPFSCLEKWEMAYCENGRHRNSVGIAVLPIYVRFFATHFLVSMKNGTTFPISCHPLSCLGITSKMICQSHFKANFKGPIHQRIQSPNISKRSGTKKAKGSIIFQCSYRDHHFQWANFYLPTFTVITLICEIWYPKMLVV